MSKHNEHSIKEVIEQMLKAYRLDDRMAEKRLISAWDNVMGAMIAKHTKEIYINNKQLYVTLDSSALRNELSMARSKIIKMLNEAVGSEVINEIILK
ncbi:MAG: DUF721 domain-containing protein [Bacteroidetes bacterium]|nr:DUF721 domain-containing protein [Bacteroidota bacterium]MCK6650488.1 DUF721 domain-containing protein [Bacteroidia bacterium]